MDSPIHDVLLAIKISPSPAVGVAGEGLAVGVLPRRACAGVYPYFTSVRQVSGAFRREALRK